MSTGEFKICFSPVNHGDKMYKNHAQKMYNQPPINLYQFIGGIRMIGDKWLSIRNDRKKRMSYSEIGRKYNIDRRTAKVRYNMSG